MQTTIFSLIDLLTNMSGTINSYEALQDKINKINDDIPKLKEEISDFKSSLSEKKYFDDSSEIVDRNIEISVSKKLATLNKELAGYQKEMKTVNKDLKKLYETIDTLKQKIINSVGSTEIIESRIEVSNTRDTKKLYQDLTDFSHEKINNYKSQLTEKEMECSELEEKADILKLEMEKLTDKIVDYNNRLTDVRYCLANKKFYENEEMKKADEEELLRLEEKLASLELEREEAINDPTMISSEIKELFASNQIEEALYKVKDLISIVKERPYMDVNDIDDLKNELERLESSQKEQMSLIENKKYIGSNIDFLNDRIDYLNMLIADKNKQITVVEEEISTIDNDIVNCVGARLKEAETEAEDLTNAIDNYYELLNANKDASVVTLNNLKISHDKKCNELNIINSLIIKYELELSNLIRKSNKLEEEKIPKYKKQIEEYESEISEIKNLIAASSKTKDVIELENDKKNLRNTIEQIKLLKRRLSFKKNPDEIYDEIEMWSSTSSGEEFDAIKEYQDTAYENEDNEDYNEEILYGINTDDNVELENKDIEPEMNTSIEEENKEFDDFEMPDINEYQVEEDNSFTEYPNIDNEENQYEENEIEITNDQKDIEPASEDYTTDDSVDGLTNKPLFTSDELDEIIRNFDSRVNANDDNTGEAKVDLNNTIEFNKSFFAGNDENEEQDEYLPKEEAINPVEVDNESITNEINSPMESPVVDIVPEIDNVPTVEDAKNVSDSTDQYTFSELEDTDYFNLDDFLKELESE